MLRNLITVSTIAVLGKGAHVVSHSLTLSRHTLVLVRHGHVDTWPMHCVKFRSIEPSRFEDKSVHEPEV